MAGVDALMLFRVLRNRRFASPLRVGRWVTRHAALRSRRRRAWR